MRHVAWATLAVVMAGCAGESGDAGARSGGAPVEVVEHAYYPRLVSEDFWEVVQLAEAAPHFLLIVHPRIKTPAEGPWTATFRDPAGTALVQHRGLRVDVATANFTFLCAASEFSPGDWSLELEVEPGGMVSGERKRLYRFRVE